MKGKARRLDPIELDHRRAGVVNPQAVSNSGSKVGSDMRSSVTFVIPLLLLTTAASGGLYRWVDEWGNVHYSDSVPPQRIKDGHTVLNDDGVRVKSIPRAKTAEEYEREQEIERLRAEQQRLLEQQQAMDQALLNSFRSEDDIIMARDGKIAAIEVKIDVIRNNIRRYREKLSELLKQAANQERSGKAVPDHLKEKILQTELEIRDAYRSILEAEKQKESIGETFEADLERFLVLKKITASSTGTVTDVSRPLLHNIVVCSDAEECDRLWETATAYVRRHATTKLQTTTEFIVITARPEVEGDISLILSRIRDKEGSGASLFLDLHCTNSIRGNMMCENPQAHSVIEGFRPTMLGEKSF